MKEPFSPNLIPDRAVLITCSSHENRCKGFISKGMGWRPLEAIIFRYDDVNPRREKNHLEMEEQLRLSSVDPITLKFTESNAVKSLHDNMEMLLNILRHHNDTAIVFDISVFTKRHLLMMLRWIDDKGFWERLCIIYSEPEDYDISKCIPLSFGLSSLHQIPGFSACPDLSRPVHLALFLGYEGDRALAVHEHLQPMQTTLVIPHPPFKPSWIGRTEQFNIELLKIVGEKFIIKADSIDPVSTHKALEGIFGPQQKRGQYARVVCPLGTKPQALGIYSYVRKCNDPPAIIYASPLRHNHDFFSYGIGNTWILKCD